MKHLFEFEGFLNEGAAIPTSNFDIKKIENVGQNIKSKLKLPKITKEAKWTPTIRLTELSGKGKIDAMVYVREIKLAHDNVKEDKYDFPVPNPYPPFPFSPLSGVVYYIDNDSTLRFVFPEGTLSQSERACIYLKIPGVRFPNTNALRNNMPVPDLFIFSRFDKPTSYPNGTLVHVNAGSKSQWSTEANVPGGRLTVITDLTKVRGKRSFSRSDKDPQSPGCIPDGISDTKVWNG